VQIFFSWQRTSRKRMQGTQRKEVTALRSLHSFKTLICGCGVSRAVFHPWLKKFGSRNRNPSSSCNNSNAGNAACTSPGSALAHIGDKTANVRRNFPQTLPGRHPGKNCRVKTSHPVASLTLNWVCANSFPVPAWAFRIVAPAFGIFPWRRGRRSSPRRAFCLSPVRAGLQSLCRRGWLLGP
jgi:hypothetical protein